MKILERIAYNWIGHLTGSICVLACLLLGGEVSAQQTRPSAGLVLARRMCSECHAVERKRLRSPNLDAPSFNTIANAPGMTAAFLTVEFQRSHQTMPNINLTANELRDVIAHILNLRRGN